MSVLAEIVARKRVDLVERKAKRSLESFRAGVRPSTKSLAEALAKPGLRFICECKKASPSEGLIRPDFDPADIARIYRPFADGVSVLTDTPYFQGDFTHLDVVRRELGQPILCKDFIVDPYQIYEARALGADVVLLMMSVLDDADYRVCAAVAEELAMDILTEVHDEDELERALSLGAKIIGINNRDLKTLKIDLATTRRLAPKIPRDRRIVCESGIRSRADIEAVSDLVDGFLVGSHLMKSARLDLSLRELIFGPVKVCGLTSVADRDAAYAAGASRGGLIFAPASPRAVDRDKARLIATDTPLPLVGVFVDAPVAQVAEYAGELALSAVQLHGEESAAYITSLRGLLPASCAIWKAVRIRDRIPSIREFGADRLLLDTYREGQVGGTGERFDWALLKQHPERDRYILAGGLNPSNIAEASALGCYGLDVNSGVESAPGIKDSTLLRQLFSALRGEV